MFTLFKHDGDAVSNGEIAFEVSAGVHTILKAERLTLNCMQRMSGIATLTRKYVDTIKGYPAKILDTRKTTPLFRACEKEAVRIGGGVNHRMGLYDMVMLKDNHIDFCGSIEKAIEQTNAYLRVNALNLKIEIETRSIDDVKRILAMGNVHRIMLDNFTPEQLEEAITLIAGKYETEASGGINLDNIVSYARTGVDFISVGAIIHHAVSTDPEPKSTNPMNKKHIVFIINPKSGVERQKEIKQAVETYLDKEKYSCEILTTEFAKHGTSLAHEAATNGAYAVVAVGGDGSVNDVVQGLLGTDTMLGIIPKGSGNGMARTMRIPLDTNEAIKIINKGNAANMDVGYANGHPFISNAGVAFDALISKKFAKSMRRGLMIYSWLVTRHMWLYKEWDWDITVDGQHMKVPAFMINIANGQQFGYNFKIAPMASFTDGVLDLIIIRKFPKILGGTLVLRAMNGSITGSPYVQHIPCQEVVISNPSLRLMQTDGDAHACANSVKFTVQKGAQKVIVP